MANQVAGIILAAGKGTRMKSEIPKVLHEVCGVPMVELVARAMREAGVTKIVVVIGHGAEQVRARLGDAYEYAVQDPPQGTGDAARVGMTCLEDWEGPVIISSGDTPLMTGEALSALVTAQAKDNASAVVATVRLPDPFGYGRVLWDKDRFSGIIEEKDATPEQKKLDEVCVSVYAFDAARLRATLPKLQPNNAQGEYYLTDIPGIMSAEGDVVITELYDDFALFTGVNDRVQLAGASSVLRNRINERHMRNGVTMIDPTSVYIGLDVEIGNDTIVFPDSHLEGKTVIGSNCEIGPNIRIKDSQVGSGSQVHHSVVFDSKVADMVRIGPYATLRNGADIGPKVKLGNFVEIKNSRLDEKVSVAHLSYIGDATVGEYTNIGAGTITCNYDGFAKHRTQIGKGAFIGTNSTLIAPVSIGDAAIIAAGSVINKDVPSDAGAFGRSRQENKDGWATRWRGIRQGKEQ